MNKNLTIFGIAIVFIIGVLVFAVGRGSRQSSQKPSITSGTVETKDFEKAPDFSLKDYDGNTVSLSDFEGQPLVINSWAVWCPFCRDELPDFVTAQKEFGEKIAFIAIDRAESHSTAKKYTDDLGITNDIVFLLDPNDSFYQSIGGFSMPETLFVDEKHNIVDHKRGPMKLEEIMERTEKLISK